MFKKQKGITLIALVVTIIVMAILVAVSIRMTTGNNGVINQAKKTASDAGLEDTKTQIHSDVLAKEIEKTETLTQEEYDEILSNYGTVVGGKFTTTDGKYEVELENIYNGYEFYVPTWKLTDEDSSGTPTVGDIVAHKSGEQFYIISVEGTQYTLLSMYNLKKDGETVTLKQDTSGSSNTVAFSSSAYWSSETSYPHPLNNYTIPSGTTSIVTTAKAYGESLGKEGRLLTKEEANTLKETIGDIIYGKYTTAGYLNYWLGSADGTSYVWLVYGDYSRLDGYGYNGTDNYGVRPVIEISRSDLS